MPFLRWSAATDTHEVADGVGTFVFRYGLITAPTVRRTPTTRTTGTTRTTA